MADQITDNRTVVCVAQTSAPASETWVGSTSPAEDTEIFIEGTTSIGEQMTDSLRYVMYDDGAARDWSNNVFYIWINCGVVGLLDIKANGGFRIRFAGNTVTDFFEVYVGGSDEWPSISLNGGWVVFVVDIELAHTNSDATGGTKPATNAIRHVGYSAVTATVKTRNADNTWIDAIWRLPDGSPGIIVEGQNGGATDWDFADINTQLGNSAGVFVPGPGGSWVCNTSIQFGINDTTTHGFLDTNQVILWDDQEFMPTDLLSLSALGNSGGVTNVTFGIKTGTVDDATGAQGVIFQAASTGVRWDMDFNDPNLDGINFYGCQVIHAGALLLDDPAVSFISTTYIDCTSALVSNSEQLRVSIINANTADGVAFMTTDDLSDIVFSSFQFSDGHAVELTTPNTSAQTSKGNLYTGYAAIGTNDAAVYNNSGAGLVTISVTDTGDSPTYRNGTSATTEVNNTVTLNVQVNDETGAGLEDVFVSIRNAATNALVSEGRTDATGLYADTTFNFVSDTDVEVAIRRTSPGYTRYLVERPSGKITGDGLSVTQKMTVDPNVGVVEVDDFRIAKQGLVSNNVSGTTITAEVNLPLSSTGKRTVVCGFGFNGGTSETISGTPTFGGNNMTLVNSEITQTDNRIWGYYYDVPDTMSGIQTVSVTFSGSVSERYLHFAVLNKVATGGPDYNATNDGNAVTTDLSVDFNILNSPMLEVAFFASDDVSALPNPIGDGDDERLLRADLLVSGAWYGLILSNLEPTTFSHSIDVEISASSKDWVGTGFGYLEG